MPSDERMERVLGVLEEQRHVFRSALGTTVDQIDHYLAEHGPSANGDNRRAAQELGPFAAGRIDMEQFSQLFRTATLDGRVRETIERARDTIAELASRNGDLFLVTVKSGAELGSAVARALEEIGRAFVAARVFDLARTGGYKDRQHSRSLGSFPFSQWTNRERHMTPPLVVTVDGADLDSASLARFMDGSTHVVLLVQGDAPPAPLVRLITPGTFVLQTHDGSGLDRLAAWDGPGIAAWMPESAARFTHDPTAGETPAERITVDHMPDEKPLRPVNGTSVFQQLEELKQLRLLTDTTAPAAPAALAAPAGASDASASAASAAPADKLAAWLLQQADLNDVV
jgi:hypothetical protein